MAFRLVSLLLRRQVSWLLLQVVVALSFRLPSLQLELVFLLRQVSPPLFRFLPSLRQLVFQLRQISFFLR